jgi:hypothetical protein|tara:strand:+ start:56 stop:313 length:258 start_codon:yes stop_codon:yes gene_type:complete
MMKLEDRTPAYYATVKMINGKVAPEDQGIVDGIKMVVKMNNEAFDTANRKYVKLQARGPRRGVYAYNQSLPLKYAVTADVYVYNR